MLFQTEPQEFMPFGLTLLWFVVGLLVSKFLPAIVKFVKEYRSPTDENISILRRFLNTVRMYLTPMDVTFLIVAIVLSAILIFFLKLQYVDARTAALGGFGWEGLVETLRGKRDPSK